MLVEDSLFATLDPTTRRTTTSDGRVYTMSDTVGFVRHLPHQLVEAFRSTLEEVADSDLILHVVDGSHPDPEGQLAAVREVFAEIGADQVPELVVINKADAADPLVLARLRAARAALGRRVSAKTGEGIAEALALVEGELPRPGRGVQGAAALRARRPDQPAAPARRDRLDGAHRRRHDRRRPRQRGPRRRARGVRRLSAATLGSPRTRFRADRCPANRAGPARSGAVPRGPAQGRETSRSASRGQSATAARGVGHQLLGDLASTIG